MVGAHSLDKLIQGLRERGDGAIVFSEDPVSRAQVGSALRRQGIFWTEAQLIVTEGGLEQLNGLHTVLGLGVGLAQGVLTLKAQRMRHR